MDPTRFCWACQAYLQPKEMPILSFVGNLDNVPANGFTIIVGSIKFKGGRAAPARVFLLFLTRMKTRMTRLWMIIWMIMLITRKSTDVSNDSGEGGDKDENANKNRFFNSTVVRYHFYACIADTLC